MANLLHRLLRGRARTEEPVDTNPQPEPPVDAAPPAEGEATPAVEGDAEAPPAEQPKPKPSARGPRKTRDETSTIGPGPD